MTNAETRIAREFHDRTAHSPYSVRTSTHVLDWDNKPLLFKVYPDLPEVELPRTFDRLSADALAAVAGPGADPAGTGPLGLETLAAVLFFSAGLTKSRSYPGGLEVHFRAAPSTGALYQTEVYVVAGAVEGLSPAIYHFSPGDFRLRRLREGDYRPALASAAADPDIAGRPATLVLTAIYWRNTWKYGARGYRHLFWDSGSMLANLLAAGTALALDPRLHAGFVDREVGALLGLDGEREVALELVLLGARESGPDAPARVVSPLALATVPLSAGEVDYPLLRQIHAASSLTSADEVRAWRGAAARPAGAPGPRTIELPPPRREAGRSLGETILRRGSTRQFSHAPISALELSTALFHASASIPGDFAGGQVWLFPVVSAVDGIEAGAYRYWPEGHRLEPIRAGDLRSRAAYLCLEQALGGDAAVTVFFLAPLDQVLSPWGNRGYRLLNLEAGLSGGRAYLAAYAQGFGATGLTYYDREVVDFFAPASAGLDAIFVTALGRSVAARRGEAPLRPLRPR